MLLLKCESFGAGPRQGLTLPSRLTPAAPLQGGLYWSASL